MRAKAWGSRATPPFLLSEVGQPESKLSPSQVNVRAAVRPATAVTHARQMDR